MRVFTAKCNVEVCTVYVGIDIGKFRHQAAFLDDAGKDLCPSLVFENNEDGFNSFFQTLASVDDGNAIIGMEATGHY